FKVVDQRAVLHRDQPAIGGNLLDRFYTLRLHRNFVIDFVTGFPIAIDDDVSVFDFRLDFASVHRNRCHAVGIGRAGINFTYASFRHADAHGKLLWLIWFDGDRDLAIPR